MKQVVVRYKLHADRVEEHESLLRRVFEELAESSPSGFGYRVLKLADGKSFVHLAELGSAGNPLASLPAFKQFVADIASRCEEPPLTSEAKVMGAYQGPAV